MYAIGRYIIVVKNLRVWNTRQKNIEAIMLAIYIYVLILDKKLLPFDKPSSIVMRI